MPSLLINFLFFSLSVYMWHLPTGFINEKYFEASFGSASALVEAASVQEMSKNVLQQIQLRATLSTPTRQWKTAKARKDFRNCERFEIEIEKCTCEYGSLLNVFRTIVTAYRFISFEFLKFWTFQYRCSICGLFLSTKFNLKRHKAIHQANVERLKCLDCGITCSNKFNYQEHCLRRHKQKPPRKPKPVLEPSKCRFPTREILYLALFFFIWATFIECLNAFYSAFSPISIQCQHQQGIDDGWKL